MYFLFGPLALVMFFPHKRHHNEMNIYTRTCTLYTCTCMLFIGKEEKTSLLQGIKRNLVIYTNLHVRSADLEQFDTADLTLLLKLQGSLSSPWQA